jgi:hypothetical protein
MKVILSNSIRSQFQSYTCSQICSDRRANFPMNSRISAESLQVRPREAMPGDPPIVRASTVRSSMMLDFFVLVFRGPTAKFLAILIDDPHRLRDHLLG